MPRWLVWGILIFLMLCIAGMFFSEKIANWINKYILRRGGKFKW